MAAGAPVLMEGAQRSGLPPSLLCPCGHSTYNNASWAPGQSRDRCWMFPGFGKLLLRPTRLPAQRAGGAPVSTSEWAANALHEGHGDERRGPGTECKAVRRVPAQRMLLRHLPKGVESDMDCQQRSAEQTAGAARQARSWGSGAFFCAKRTEPGTLLGPAETPRPASLRQGGLCFNSDWGKKIQLNKQKNQSHTCKKFCFGLSKCIVVSRPPPPPPPSVPRVAHLSPVSVPR